MANYLVVYKGGSMAATEAEREASMAAWMQWFGGLGAAVVDHGNPFGPSKSITGSGSVSDSGASKLTGYSVIKADDLGAATGMVKSCPILGDGGTVEVYEAVDVGM